jgi:uncharacterized protein
MVELKFDWDEWNQNKNESKHGVSKLEAESVFFDPRLKIFDDLKHSHNERRLIAFGKSLENRVLMIGFTLRTQKVRIITARSASKKERQVYEKKVESK